MRIEPRDQPLLRHLLDELGITEQAPGQPESLDDLVPFFSYASEEPQSLKFNLQGEEAEQKSTLDLLLGGIGASLRFSMVGDDVWKDPIATTAWKNMRSGKSFYRHYWKSELIEWINHLKDCEQGPCTSDNSDDPKDTTKIQNKRASAMGSWILESHERCLEPLCGCQNPRLGHLLPFLTRKPQCCGMAYLLVQGNQRYPVASRNPWRNEPPYLCATTSPV